LVLLMTRVKGTKIECTSMDNHSSMAKMAK